MSEPEPIKMMLPGTMAERDRLDRIERVARFLYETMMGRMEDEYKWPRVNTLTGERFTWENETDDCKGDWRFVAQSIIESPHRTA